MSKEKQEVIKEIEKKINEIEERFNAGKIILIQVKQQLKILKAKMKEYRQLHATVSSSAADGDL